MAVTGKAQLVQGTVLGTITRLSGPMLVGALTMVMFNLIDTYFVGQLGTRELAAVSFTFPVVMLIASLALGLGVGASAVISRTIGAGDEEQVRRLTTDSLILGLMIVIFFSIIGLLTIDPLFTLLGADAETLPFIRDYISIWYVALMFVVIPMVGNSAIRATGDARTPAMIMIFAVTVNGILDPILIFGFGPIPALGVQGAALATAISRGLTMLAALYVLHFRERMLTFRLPGLPVLVASWRRILYVGIPAGATQMLIPLSTGIITGMVAVYGTEAVAAYGVASRMEMFGLVVIVAVSMSLTPFVGQNWGAKRMDRVVRALRYSQMFALGWGALLMIVFGVFGPQIAPIFNDDPAVIEPLARYLWIVPLSFGLQGVLTVVNASLNALNRPLQSAGLSMLRLFGLYVPVAVVLSNWMGLDGIFVAAAVANIGSGLIAWWWARRALSSEQASRPVVTTPSGVPVPVANGD